MVDVTDLVDTTAMTEVMSLMAAGGLSQVGIGSTGLPATKEEARALILQIQGEVEKLPGAEYNDSERNPVTHSFSEGIYVRQIFIPAETIIVGKIHKHEHPNFLLQGRVSVFTEYNGVETLEAPLQMISKAGTKRVVYTHTDTVWTTIHANPSNTTDLAVLEDEIIAGSYEEYEKFIGDKLCLSDS